MRNHKNLFQSIMLFVLTSGLILAAPVSGIAQDFTDADAKILSTSADPDAVAEIIYKLSDIYEAKGKDGLKPAVDALLKAAERELSIPEDQRWNIYDIIKVASLTGDERVKPLMLHIMSVMNGGGNPFTAHGLHAIGHSTVKDVVDSLKSSSDDTKGRAAITIHKMFEADESGTFFTQQDRDTIRKILVENLANENANVRIYNIVALRSFGDASVVAPLEHLEKNDAQKDSGGIFEVRLEATETLKIIEGAM